MWIYDKKDRQPDIIIIHFWNKLQINYLIGEPISFFFVSVVVVTGVIYLQVLIHYWKFALAENMQKGGHTTISCNCKYLLTPPEKIL